MHTQERREYIVTTRNPDVESQILKQILEENTASAFFTFIECGKVNRDWMEFFCKNSLALNRRFQELTLPNQGSWNGEIDIADMIEACGDKLLSAESLGIAPVVSR